MSKSRAQELRMRIDSIKQDIQSGQVSLAALESELKLICPHPDEYVKKLDAVYSSQVKYKKLNIYVCKLCGQTKRKGN